MPDHNADFLDILNVLNWGKVNHNPDHDCEMKFRVDGFDIDGEPLTVIVILTDTNSLFVKTLW